jgi:DNA repair exonuclease SbcCD nuclease subunit
MMRLQDAGIAVVTVKGNHDAASRVTKSLRMPGNVRTLSDRRPESAVFEDIGLAVHGQSFATAAVTEDLSAAYPDPLAGLVNVGLLHTSADGRPGHEPYAPCDPHRLAERGYQYWALGHVHQREVLVAEPPVVFSGCLQGRHVRETGPKGATLVRVDGDGTVSLEERVLDHVRWALCEVDAAGAADEDEVYARVADGLRETADAADDRLLAVRVQFTGATAAHTPLARDPDRVRHEVALAAAGVARGDVWVERVVAGTRPQAMLSGEGDDAYAEIVRAIRASADDAAMLGDLAEELRPMQGKLPGALLADFDPTARETLIGILDQVEATLPSRLLEEGTR